MLGAVRQEPGVDLPDVVEGVWEMRGWRETVVDGEDRDVEGVGPDSGVVLVAARAHGDEAAAMDMHYDDTFLLEDLVGVELAGIWIVLLE